MSNSLFINSVRTHDLLYLQHEIDIKEYFKFIIEHATNELSRLKDGRVIDIGCANGTFLRYLNSLFPALDLTGLDVLPPLLAKAREVVPSAHFVRGDITKPSELAFGAFDCVFMNGVHGMFDDCALWVKHVTQLVKEGGTGFVFGPFNDFDMDVVARVRKSGDSGPYENGWNTISKASFRTALKNCGVSSVDFYDFEMPFDIMRREEDPMRSWTIMLENGRRMVINGASMIRPQALAKFTV